MKFSLFPIKNNKIWLLYKKQLGAIWTAEEIDFSKDYDDFKQLDYYEQESIKLILAFFANSDGLVNFNIKNNFLNFDDNVVGVCYTFQMMMENIHNEVYSLMIETLIKDEDEKDILFNSITNLHIINTISQWALKYSNNNLYTLSEKILVFICIEGIIFSGSFAFIYWLKSSKKNMFMNGLIKSNELIARDESMHVEFGVELFKQQNKIDNIPNFLISKIILECVAITKKFNEELIMVKYTGMNIDLMNKYTEYVADRIYVDLGFSKFFNTANPFSFMDTIGMVQKTNFHESRPTEYQKANFGTIEYNYNDDF